MNPLNGRISSNRKKNTQNKWLTDEILVLQFEWLRRAVAGEMWIAIFSVRKRNKQMPKYTFYAVCEYYKIWREKKIDWVV